MRRSVAGLLLTLVASFTLAACNDTGDDPKGNTSPGEAPVEVEFDFDSSTKTKTVTAVPTLTTRPYQPPTRSTPTVPKRKATR